MESWSTSTWLSGWSPASWWRMVSLDGFDELRNVVSSMVIFALDELFCHAQCELCLGGQLKEKYGLIALTRPSVVTENAFPYFVPRLATIEKPNQASPIRRPLNEPSQTSSATSNSSASKRVPVARFSAQLNTLTYTGCGTVVRSNYSAGLTPQYIVGLIKG